MEQKLRVLQQWSWVLKLAALQVKRQKYSHTDLMLQLDQV